MRILLFVSALAIVGAAAAQTGNVTATRGTVVDIPADDGDATPRQLPRRSMTMAQVRQRHGEPRVRHKTVGDPPITRWDYAGFSVFFEHDRVLHAVVPGDFPQISHRDELQQ